MADNNEPGDSQKDNIDFDDDIDFDLDLFDDADDPDQSEFFTASEDDDSSLENELHDDLHDDLTDDLDSDVIDLSSEEVQAEFAALDLENSAQDSRSRSEDLEDFETDFDEGFKIDDQAAAFQTTGETTATSFNEHDIEDDPDIYDDLDSDLSRAEFGAPGHEEPGRKQDQDSQKISAEPDQQQTVSLGHNLPALLAPFASLSPKIIVAVTAAVLLPVVIVTVLGFNSGEADGDTALQSANAEIQSNNDADPLATEANPVAAQSGQVLPERPIPETIDMPVLPSEDSTPAETDQPVDPALIESLLADVEAEPIDVMPEEAIDDTLSPPAQVPADSNEQTADTDDSNFDAPDLPSPQTQAAAAADTEPESAAAIENEQSDESLLANADPASGNSDDEIAGSSAPADADLASSTSLAEPVSSGRDYHIIVASFPNESQAQAHAERISDEEISAYVIAPFADASNFRVAVASYSSMAEAQSNIPGLRAVYGEGIWPLRYPPAAETALISEQTGATYIIVASFPNEQLARSHAQTLVAAGEQPSIIAAYAPANRFRVAIASYADNASAQSALVDYRREYGEDLWLLRY